MPGQFCPMSRVFLKSKTLATRTMSRAGMPSVMHTMMGSPASAASRIASAAYCGARKMTEAFAPVAFAASATVLKTGRSRCFVPPLPGVTPPTTFVAVLNHLLSVKSSLTPVEALDIRRVFFVDQDASSRTSRESHDLLGAVLHCRRDGEIEAAVAENLLADFHVGSFHAHDKPGHLILNPWRQPPRRCETSQRRDAAEYVDEHGFHGWIASSGCGRRSSPARRRRRRLHLKSLRASRQHT